MNQKNVVKQCLARRIADQETLVAEVKAWQEERNASKERAWAGDAF